MFDRFFSSEFLIFLVTGSVNTVFTFLIYTGLIFFHVHYGLANLIAWFLGVTLSFFLNSVFVFKSKIMIKNYFKFFASNIFGLTLSLVGLIILVELFLVNQLVAAITIIPLIVASNFVLQRFVVFKGS